jgi:membrane protein implicated in regulation of membrane protease activity
MVIDTDERGGGLVQLADPAVIARCDGELPLGERVTVRLVQADPAARAVRFTLS